MQLHLHPLMKSCCLQYSRFIRLLEKLMTLPCGDIEENYIKKFSKEIAVQLQKVSIEPLKYDEQGVAYSTGEGNNFKLVGADLFSSHYVLYNVNVCMTRFECFFLYTYMYIGYVIVNDVLKHWVMIETKSKFLAQCINCEFWDLCREDLLVLHIQ